MRYGGDRWPWFVWQIVVGLSASFFLFIGIDTLIRAYHLKNPLEFIVYFFSSSFMILISAVGILWPIANIYRLVRPGPGGHQRGEDPSDEQGRF